MPLSALAGLTLLVVGESHMTLNGYLRDPLQKDLMEQGVKHSFAEGACGASPARMVTATSVDCFALQTDTQPVVLKGKEGKTVPIADLIAQDKPDVVVIIMGDTMGSYDKPVFPKVWAWQEVTELTKAVAATNTACIWVGPGWGTPGGSFSKNYARVQELSDFLANNVAPCEYISSLTYAKPGQWPTIDGEHYTSNGYDAWAKSIVASLEASPTIAKVKAEQ